MRPNLKLQARRIFYRGNLKCFMSLVWCRGYAVAGVAATLLSPQGKCLAENGTNLEENTLRWKGKSSQLWQNCIEVFQQTAPTAVLVGLNR